MAQLVAVGGHADGSVREHAHACAQLWPTVRWARHGCGPVLSWAAQLWCTLCTTHGVQHCGAAPLSPWSMCEPKAHSYACTRWTADAAHCVGGESTSADRGQGALSGPQHALTCTFPTPADPGVLNGPLPPIPGLRPGLGVKLPSSESRLRPAPLSPSGLRWRRFQAACAAA